MFSIKNIPALFIFTGLLCLAGGLFFGCIGALQYLVPSLFEEWMPFTKTRPLHVTFVLSWIVFAVTGIIYDYLLREQKLIRWTAVIHFAVFLATGVIILACFAMGIFGGREYFEFPPVLVLPILAGWILFAIAFFVLLMKKKKPVPVYLWMWGTGIVFMIFTLSEAHFWYFPFFSGNLVRDMTVQWKSYGALIGSWNMLIYGTAAYLMNCIHPDEKTIYGRLSFALYLLGLTNLFFGWGHHIYILPAHPWIRHIAYFISMTELLILGKMIWNWKKSFNKVKNYRENIPFHFLYSADVWVILNLALAITISVPAINYFTHGTHFTVAHAMGTTIGINTAILIAALLWIVGTEPSGMAISRISGLKTGFYIFNISLLVFWLTLIFMGVIRSRWMYSEALIPFSEMDASLFPYYFVLFISGTGVVTGILFVIAPVLDIFFRKNSFPQ